MTVGRQQSIGFRCAQAFMLICCGIGWLFAVGAHGLSAKEPVDYPPLDTKAIQAAEELCGLPLLVTEQFTSGADRWEPTDPKAWTVIEQNGNKVYCLLKKRSDFNPPVRSPYNRSLLKDVVVENFVLDLYVQSTHPDYGHRDLCLFFGYRDDSHLYYVHLGKKTDPHANQIFIVNDAPRTKISEKTTPGTNWTDDWHHVRLVRDVKTGDIKVYFDDMQTPAMTAVDRTFTSGRIGVGSFDDIGNFDEIRLYAK